MTIGDSILLGIVTAPILLFIFFTCCAAIYYGLGAVGKVFHTLFQREKKPIFCVDCKHIVARAGVHSDYWACARSEYIRIHPADLVTGFGERKDTFCNSASSERSRHGSCGPKAKLFEPKETL